MPAAHRMSQSGQWQQLQSQWEQQQQQRQQAHEHQQHTRHDPYFHHHQQQQPPYNDYHTNEHHSHHPAYPPYPPPHPLTIPPLLLRIAVSPTQTEDLPIDVSGDADVGAIARHFCATHHIAGESKLQKLQAMIERSVEQHREQHVPVQPASYYPPYAADSHYEQEYGGGYYDAPQVYAEHYGGQHGVRQPMASTPSPHPSQLSGFESDDLSPLLPTFTPSRPTSALSHTSATQHSRRESNTPSAQHFSHSQPTPTLRPSSLTLPSSSTPSPRSSSPRPISPHTAGYLNAPASARLYANAAVKQRQLVRHQQQKQQLDNERQQQELQECTFAPRLTPTNSNNNNNNYIQQSERRKGRKQYEWIEDWNGNKREQRLARMREMETKRIKQEECSFTPMVNAVSHQLVQLNKNNPSAKKSIRDKQLNNIGQEKSKKLDAAAKAKITQFLQRTIERQQQQKEALAKLQENNLKLITPSFVPTITIKAQAIQPAYNKPTATHNNTNNTDSSTPSGSGSSGSTCGSGGSGGVVTASQKKRQRRCEELYRCFGDSGGYIDRSGWMRLVKGWYMRERRLEGMRWQLEMDDVQVIQMVIRECDRQVRRDRKAGGGSGSGRGANELEDGEDYTWQLSLADFQLWMEKLWGVVLDRAKTAEREEERMVHKFTPTPDP